MQLNSKYLNWGSFSAVLVLVGLAAYHVLAPMPGESTSKPPKSAAELAAEKEKAKKSLADSDTKVKSLTWSVSRDEVGPSAMAWVSNLAQASNVTVQAFRPQRSVDDSGLVQLNYLVTAEGGFLQVMGLLKSLEAENSLLAVRAVQIASLDGTTDTVRATIALVAYQVGEDVG